MSDDPMSLCPPDVEEYGIRNGLPTFAKATWHAGYIDGKRIITQAFLDCCQYDATMEGPKFKGYNRSALDRLRKLLERKVR